MTVINSQVFNVNGVDYQVKKPYGAEYKAAQMEFNKTFGEAIKAGAVLKERLRDYMHEQGIWTKEKNDKFIALITLISDGEKALEAGNMKLSDAIKLAKSVKKHRADLQEIVKDRAIAESNSAEGQAENAKFQRLLTLCLVYKEDGKPVFNSIDELLTEKDEIKLEVSGKGFDILSNLIYDLDTEQDKKLPENQFLLKWKLMNDKLQLLDKDGNPVDDLGNKINEKGELVDVEVVEPKPFLDDDGNPITPPE